MTPPQCYADWLPLLDRFEAGDDEVLPVLRQGAIPWTNVVAERWTARLVEVLNGRLKALSALLQRSLDRPNSDYGAISNALLLARRRLAPLREFASLPAAPEPVRNHLQAELTAWARQSQESLERSAQHTRNDHGRLLKTIRDNALDRAPLEQHPDPSASQPELAGAPAGQPFARARRIIL